MDATKLGGRRSDRGADASPQRKECAWIRQVLRCRIIRRSRRPERWKYCAAHVGFPVPPPHAIVHAVPGFTLVRAYAEAQGILTERKGLASALGWRYSSMCPRTQVRATPPCHGTLTVTKTISA